MCTKVAPFIRVSYCPANTKHLYAIIQRRPNVFVVSPTLYKCYTNVLRLLGGSIMRHLTFCWRAALRLCENLTSVW